MQGKISQIMGAVVDVEFPGGKLPEILNALEIERDDTDNLIIGGDLLNGLPKNTNQTKQKMGATLA